VTVGASVDLFEGGIRDREQVNPKLGVTWNPLPATTVRGAVFRTFERLLITDQTLEPTQVAGFNQFFDDGNATDAWRYGVGIDQKVSEQVYAGAEITRRTLDVPFSGSDPGVARLANWKEELGRAHFYWTPTSWLAFNGEYQYEHLEREGQANEGIIEAHTHRFPVAIGVFHPLGFRGRLQATVVDQSGTFGDPAVQVTHGDERFWILDASIGYRLPKRWGVITVDGRNLLDKRFRFQDTDPANPQIQPERLIVVRLIVAY
jgi:outer membrane receptor protein involved in Fe transport